MGLATKGLVTTDEDSHAQRRAMNSKQSRQEKRRQRQAHRYSPLRPGSSPTSQNTWTLRPQTGTQPNLAQRLQRRKNMPSYTALSGRASVYSACRGEPGGGRQVTHPQLGFRPRPLLAHPGQKVSTLSHRWGQIEETRGCNGRQETFLSKAGPPLKRKHMRTLLWTVLFSQGSRESLTARVNRATRMCACRAAGRQAGLQGKIAKTASYTLLQLGVSCQSSRLEALQKNPVEREGAAREKPKPQV